jgi:hypothetical protein
MTSERTLDLEDKLAEHGLNAIRIKMGEQSFDVAMGMCCARCGGTAIGREQRALHGPGLCTERTYVAPQRV